MATVLWDEDSKRDGPRNPKSLKRTRVLPQARKDRPNWIGRVKIRTSKDLGFVFVCGPEQRHASRIFACDLDDTLLFRRSLIGYPKSRNDWGFCREMVHALVQARDLGMRIVVVTNQRGAVTRTKQIELKIWLRRVVAELLTIGIPVEVFGALGERYAKPKGILWEVIARSNGSVSIDKDRSIYVGDAAGRIHDFSDSDRRFAEAGNIPFVVPEEIKGWILDQEAERLQDRPGSGSRRRLQQQPLQRS